MENKSDVQFDFCPRCGALARDGVCTSCGYQSPDAQINPEPAEETMQPEVVQPEAPVQETPVQEAPVQEAPVQETPVQQAMQPGGYYGSPYSEYSNQSGYSNGAIPPDVPVKKSNGKTIAIICTCAGIFVALIGLLIFFLVKIVNNMQAAFENQREEDYLEESADDYFDDEYDTEGYDDDDYDYSEFYKDALERNQKDSEKEVIDGKTYGFSPEDDYYKELNDAIRDDLSYSVEFTDKDYVDPGKDVDIYCVYPVLDGDIPNVDYLNEYIYSEYQYFEDYYLETVKEDMDDDEYFWAQIEGFVTYMDEKYLSIVFSESADWNDDYFLTTLYCINIDVENGRIIDNTEMLEVNDEFSVDFRIRESEQNQSETLDVYTDQELTEMLSDPIDLIVFYTPLGLEVGVNHDTGWATATYKDYEKYLKNF